MSGFRWEGSAMSFPRVLVLAPDLEAMKEMAEVVTAYRELRGPAAGY